MVCTHSDKRKDDLKKQIDCVVCGSTFPSVKMNLQIEICFQHGFNYFVYFYIFYFIYFTLIYITIVYINIFLLYYTKIYFYIPTLCYKTLFLRKRGFDCLSRLILRK